MSAEILVTGDVSPYTIRICECGSETRHEVSVSKSDQKTISALKISGADYVEAAFRFLLERESKESILRAFELSVIREYFPEFDQKISSYLKK